MLAQHLENTTNAWDGSYAAYQYANHKHKCDPSSDGRQVDELYKWAYSCQRAWRVAQFYFILDRIPR